MTFIPVVYFTHRDARGTPNAQKILYVRTCINAYVRDIRIVINYGVEIRTKLIIHFDADSMIILRYD